MTANKFDFYKVVDQNVKQINKDYYAKELKQEVNLIFGPKTLYVYKVVVYYKCDPVAILRGGSLDMHILFRRGLYKYPKAEYLLGLLSDLDDDYASLYDKWKSGVTR